MKRTLAAIAAVALAGSFSASAAIAAVITIDDFNVDQTVIAALEGNPAAGSVTGAASSMIGGVRHVQVQTAEVPGPGEKAVGTSLSAEKGAMDFLNDATSTGTGWLVYDGTANRAGLPTPATVAGLDFGATVNTTGLNANLLMGQPTGFFTFAAGNLDHTDPGDLLFSAFAWDTLGNSVGYFESIDPFNFSPTLNYDEFQTTWGIAGQGNFDWGKIGALAFRIDSTRVALDGQIFAISATPIPLPASALLLLGGLGGLAAFTKRRRKA